MKFVFSGADVFLKEKTKNISASVNLDVNGDAVSNNTISCDNYSVFPGFVDVHVHFREPGFSYKETIVSGSRAAARGGYTDVCTMPNLKPAPDSLENLKLQLDLIERGSVINTVPFGTITKGELGLELSDMEAMAPFVCGYSDDGRGVNDAGLMREAMARAKALDKIISAHCEDGTAPLDSPEAEWQQIERDIKLAAETGVKYHVCHISTKESVSLIRDAKKNGVDITCETAPHYLLLSDKDILDDGRFRMNPPLRKEADRLALLEGLYDGTVDMIATDHAPHSAEEKSRGLKSLNGIVGLEVAFPVLYTDLVRKGELGLGKLIDVMSFNPAERFGLKTNGFCLYDLNTEYTIDPSEFATMGRSTPFSGKAVFGRCLATVIDGRVAFLDAGALNINK